jgi:predicted alpha-1,2-mannosidase
VIWSAHMDRTQCYNSKLKELVLTYRGQRSWNLWAACLGFLCGLVLMSAEIPAGIAVAQTVTPQDKAHAIDPFTAAASGGNVFVGPTLPFGMAKPGPDMNIGENDANAGWAATGKIRGFSQTHVSGTGGGAKYGNILIQPTAGAPASSAYDSPRSEEKAEIGLYSVELTRYRIKVEVTAARMTALYRFTFPASDRSNILFDVGRCLVSGVRSGEAQRVKASQITILSPTEVSGSTSVTGGWNKQPNTYTVYFYAKTDAPASSWGIWKDGALRTQAKDANGGARNGAWLTFRTHEGQQLELKVGISFVSVDQARRNATQEVPSFDFEAVRQRLVDAWNNALASIDFRGETQEQRGMMFTALYHAMMMPTDRTGENPLWHSNEPYYDDYYAIWDTFRCANPLLTLIAPQRETDIVRSLVDIYRHEGWLPDARSGNYNGRTQGGSNAEFLIADAFVKGLKGIDWNEAYRAVVNDAENPPRDQFKEGRGGLADWKQLGYVSVEAVDRPGSKQMEYAADDYEIAVLAAGLGKENDSKKYAARAENWRKLWDAQLTDGGISGFIHPRHRDGSWLEPFTPLDSGSWGSKTFYEGNAWTYSTFVPQDVAGLINVSGGRQKFVERLDAFFDVPGRYDVGNEPGFLSPYLYIWAGRHDRTAERIRAIIAENFHPGRNGMAFNDDSGAMSAWYALAQIGLYPNAGQDVYLIGSPTIPETSIHLANGKDFKIVARNVSCTNKYVVGAELNGKPLGRAWLRHRELVDGGELILMMAARPSHWGADEEPPSSLAKP